MIELSEIQTIRDEVVKLEGMLIAMKEIADQNNDKAIDMSCALDKAASLCNEIANDVENLQECFMKPEE